MQKKWWGAHVSAAGSVVLALERASQLKARSCALFVKNQRQWNASPLSQKVIQDFQNAKHEMGWLSSQILPHGSYLINLASPKPEIEARSINALKDELKRAKCLGISALNIHPGSSLGQISPSSAAEQIAKNLTNILGEVSDISVYLENTAGQGYTIGSRLEELSDILKKIPSALRQRVSICLDTCHAFAAGYPLKSGQECEKFFQEFEEIIGFQHLKAMHLNDSQTSCGSRVDRHAGLGEGHIGFTLFEYIAQDPRFCGMPLILETPDPLKWSEEINWLKCQE